MQKHTKLRVQQTATTNKLTGDARTIAYRSSETKIATVNASTGLVSFVSAGTVIISATKEAEGELAKVTDSYILYISMKPANKQALVEEIKRAIGIGVDGVVPNYEVDLNYIDTSAITDMSRLFSSSKTYGFRLHEFNGNISEWDVSSVQDMGFMFAGAAKFNKNLNDWNVSSVTNMYAMFFGATSFNQDISSWAHKGGRVTAFMFWNATAMQAENKPSWVR